MALDITDPAPSGESQVIDVVMFERRRARWAPVFTGRIAPTHNHGTAGFSLTIHETTRR